MSCGVGHITKNSANVFSACRKRRLKETGRGDWESPPLYIFPQRQHERRGVAGRLTSPRALVVGLLNVRGCSSIESKRCEIGCMFGRREMDVLASARGRPRFGWMDGVKRALNDRRINIREASEHARNRNEWRMIVTQF